MENEYITRAAAVAISDYAADEHPYEKLGGANSSEYNEGWNDACDYIREKLENDPAADVQPVVHGEWINVYGNFSTAECVVCKSQFEVTFGEESNGALWDGFCQFYRYCPNCGARMDGEQK